MDEQKRRRRTFTQWHPPVPTTALASSSLVRVCASVTFACHVAVPLIPHLIFVFVRTIVNALGHVRIASEHLGHKLSHSRHRLSKPKTHPPCFQNACAQGTGEVGRVGVCKICMLDFAPADSAAFTSSTRRTANGHQLMTNRTLYQSKY